MIKKIYQKIYSLLYHHEQIRHRLSPYSFEIRFQFIDEKIFWDLRDQFLYDYFLEARNVKEDIYNALNEELDYPHLKKSRNETT